MERWQGRSPREEWNASEFLDLTAIRTRWEDIAADTQRLIAGFTESDLARVVGYINPHGEHWAYPIWQSAFDQVNHATQHRSEAAARLTELGHSPGELDFLHDIDALSSHP